MRLKILIKLLIVAMLFVASGRQTFAQETGTTSRTTNYENSPAEPTRKTAKATTKQIAAKALSEVIESRITIEALRRENQLVRENAELKDELKEAYKQIAEKAVAESENLRAAVTVKTEQIEKYEKEVPKLRKQRRGFVGRALCRIGVCL